MRPEAIEHFHRREALAAKEVGIPGCGHSASVGIAPLIPVLELARSAAGQTNLWTSQRLPPSGNCFGLSDAKPDCL